MFLEVSGGFVPAKLNWAVECGGGGFVSRRTRRRGLGLFCENEWDGALWYTLVRRGARGFGFDLLELDARGRHAHGDVGMAPGEWRGLDDVSA